MDLDEADDVPRGMGQAGPVRRHHPHRVRAEPLAGGEMSRDAASERSYRSHSSRSSPSPERDHGGGGPSLLAVLPLSSSTVNDDAAPGARSMGPFMPWHERQAELDRRHHERCAAAERRMAVAEGRDVPRLPPMDTSNGALRCVLCIYREGHDADCTGLFKELTRRIRADMGHKPYDLLAHEARTHYETFMRPQFAKGGVTLPPFDYGAVLEHLTTLKHTVHPAHMLLMEIRDTKDEMVEMREYSRKRGEEPDRHMFAEIRKHRAMLFSMYRAGGDLGKLAFYRAEATDVAPDMQQFMSRAERMHTQDRREALPHAFEQWMEQDLQQEARAGLAALSSAAPPLPRAEDLPPSARSLLPPLASTVARTPGDGARAQSSLGPAAAHGPSPRGPGQGLGVGGPGRGH